MIPINLNQNIYKSLVLLVGFYALWCGFGFYTQAKLQKLKYQVVGNLTRDTQQSRYIGHSNKLVEIRRYEEYTAIQAIYRGVKLQVAMEMALQDIGSYFLGKNSASQKIEMALPIMIERITTENAFVVSIPVSSEYKSKQLPAPLNPKLTIKKVGQRTLATKYWKGSVPGITLMNIKKNKILSIIQESNYNVKGNALLFQYDSPLSPGWMRKNEVVFEVSQKQIQQIVSA